MTHSRLFHHKIDVQLVCFWISLNIDVYTTSTNPNHWKWWDQIDLLENPLCTFTMRLNNLFIWHAIDLYHWIYDSCNSDSIASLSCNLPQNSMRDMIYVIRIRIFWYDDKWMSLHWNGFCQLKTVLYFVRRLKILLGYFFPFFYIKIYLVNVLSVIFVEKSLFLCPNFKWIRIKKFRK